MKKFTPYLMVIAGCSGILLTQLWPGEQRVVLSGIYALLLLAAVFVLGFILGWHSKPTQGTDHA